MKKNQTWYFSYNLPADNHQHGTADHYIDIKAERVYTTCIVTPLVDKIDLRLVKNWNKVLNDVEEIGQEHFEAIIKQEKIDAAWAEIAIQGAENPVMERLIHSGLFDTISIGGVEYSNKAKLNNLPVTILSAFGGANEKCKIKDWLDNVKIVETQDLKLTEMSTA